MDSWYPLRLLQGNDYWQKSVVLVQFKKSPLVGTFLVLQDMNKSAEPPYRSLIDTPSSLALLAASRT